MMAKSDNQRMLNAQVSSVNEWANGQCINALNHLAIDNSLKIVNCKLKIASEGGMR